MGTLLAACVLVLIGVFPSSSDRASTGDSGPTSSPFVFAAAGDHGQNANTQASLDALQASGAAFYLALGDLSYGSLGGEQSWCDMVTATVGTTYPFELVSGNHEDDNGGDGWIGDFVNCLPDRLGSTGVYGAQYYFDYPPGDPLVRAIMIAADLTVFGVTYNYAPGNPEYDWLATTIDEARAAGIPWVIVAMHKNCITTGSKSCEIGAALFNLLMAKRVDLILQGHDHNVQRSKQLACPSITVNGYNPTCVVDDGSDDRYEKGLGPVLVISGSFGRCCYAVSWSDSEAGYFVAIDDATNGFWTYAVDASSLTATFIPTTGSFTDSFAIVGAAPPPPPTNLGAEMVGVDQHPRITWTPSSPETDLDHYEVWRSGQYDPLRVGYAKVSPDLPPGTLEWTDSAPDPLAQDAFYFVRAVGTSMSAASAGQVARLTRTITTTQPYLLSVPVLTSSSRVEDHFRGTFAWSLAREFVASDPADPWKRYDPLKAFNDFTTVDVTRGVWVEVTVPGEYRVAGAVPCVVAVDLKAGWNLVGFPSATSMSVAIATGSLVGPLAVEGYDPAVPPYFLKRLGPADLLDPMQGFWIESPIDQTWTVVNDPSPSCVPRP